jgi:SAM-dependent methyltransferase
MQIEPPSWRVADIAACPACRSRIDFAADAARCASCGRAFGMSAGIPLLIPDGMEVADSPGMGAGQARTGLRAIERRLASVSQTHVFKSPALDRLVDDFVAAVPGRGPILNIGAGDTDYGPRMVNLEIAPAPGIDVVGVAEALPFTDGAFDGVVLQAVLEHVRNADATLSEMARVMTPGAFALVDVPFIQAYHASPHDYRRYTKLGLRTAIERTGLEVKATGVSAGPASALSWILAEVLSLLFQGKHPGQTRRKASRAAAGFLTLPVRRMDRWLDTREHADIAASGVWATATRPAR